MDIWPNEVIPKWLCPLSKCNRNISPEIDFECPDVALAEALAIDVAAKLSVMKASSPLAENVSLRLSLSRGN
jgi:hypothetical protein